MRHVPSAGKAVKPFPFASMGDIIFRDGLDTHAGREAARQILLALCDDWARRAAARKRFERACSGLSRRSTAGDKETLP